MHWWERRFGSCGNSNAWAKNARRGQPVDITKLVSVRGGASEADRLLAPYTGRRGVLSFTAYGLAEVAYMAGGMAGFRWAQEGLPAEALRWAAESEEHCRAALALRMGKSAAADAKALLVLAGYGHELVGHGDPRDELPDMGDGMLL